MKLSQIKTEITATIKAAFVLLTIVFTGLNMLVSTWGAWVILVTLISVIHKPLRRYAFNLWLTLDQSVNASLLGNEDDTISGRTGVHASEGSPVALKMEIVIDALFWKGHCRDSIEKDEQTKKYRAILRETFKKR